VPGGHREIGETILEMAKRELWEKTDADTEIEDQTYLKWIESFPEYQKKQFQDLLEEMLALEYDLQLTYGAEEVAFSPYTAGLKEYINNWTREKIEKSKQGE